MHHLFLIKAHIIGKNISAILSRHEKSSEHSEFQLRKEHELRQAKVIYGEFASHCKEQQAYFYLAFADTPVIWHHGVPSSPSG